MAALSVSGARWLRAVTLLRAGGSRVAPLWARPASDLSKDMLPGPYPKTPEERAAAAKKYNMRVEDYEPYPDDGMGYGDYPKLPDRSQHERDPWYSWDHSDLRHNYGEPIHWEFDFFAFLGLIMILFYIGHLYPAYQPVGPKQYPYNDLYLERGGDPNKEPPEVKHYEI
uniref:NADH dehydrogenase [ubiquinone] 1 beta subcomplex subunit 8, mitochondrial n=1 Tax=Sphenodon punctatus TaxID=8508 RepID=A0A8D0GU08_SPHPU